MSKEGNTGAKIHCAVCGRTFDAAADKCPNCSAPASLSQPVSEPREEKREPVFVCTVCGLKIKSESAPEKCPKCESPAELFKAQKDGIARMRCSICGFEIEGDTAPDRCENCGVDGDMFEPVKN